MTRGVVVLLALTACGRFGFDAAPGDGAASDAAPADASGSGGPRWVVPVGGAATVLPLTGAQGAPTVAFAFNGTTTVAGQTLTGVASSLSSALVQFDASGTVRAATVLDAQFTCDIRGLSMRGSSVLAAGFSNGNQTTALGACSVQTSGRQIPLVLAVDPTGGTMLLATGAASTANAQGWNVAPLSDGTFITSGIYGSGLAFGPNMLPTAGADPNAFVARLMDGVPTPVWATSLNGGVQITPGPLAVEGNDTCELFAYNGGGLTLLGVTPPYMGASDELVARLDPSGTPLFVHSFGSTGAESNFNKGAVVAQGGGCVAAAVAPGDLVIDTIALPASQGLGVIVWYAATGLTGAYRTPGGAVLALAGTRVIAAYDVKAPVDIGADHYVPQGSDVIVVEVTAQGPTRLLGAVGGAGDQTVISLAAIADDAVAIGLSSTGELTFGAQTLPVTGTDAVAVLGI